MNWEKLIQSGFRMPFYMDLYVRGSLEDVEKIIGLKYGDNLVVLERQINTVYFNSELQKKIEDIVKNKITQKKFRDKFVAVFESTDRKLLQLCSDFRFIDYSKLSTISLIKKLDKFSNLFKGKFGIYGLPVIIDMALEEKLSVILSNRISNDDLFTLTKPKKQSEYIQEREDLIRIILKIKKLALVELFNNSREEIFDKLGRYNPGVFHDIEKHVRDFNWVGVSHHVLPMTMDTFLETIKIGLKDASIDAELKSINTLNTENKKKDVICYNKLNKGDLEIVEFITKLNEIKEERKIAMSKAILWSYPLFEAISNVLNIDTISLRQLTLEEVKHSLVVGKLSNKQKMLMNDRLDLCVCMAKGGKIYNFSGDKARKILEKELGNKEIYSIQELKGNIAQKGFVRGVVRLIMSEHQVKNLVEGEVLVSSMTDPDMIVAMKKAAAFVTDEGGITCHAAIVARELKKPCIIGTKIATKVLKDGDLVEVNADTGIVTILKRKL